MSVEELLNNGYFGFQAKPVKDYEDYIATNFGLIWSKKSKKFLNCFADNGGYLSTHLYKNKIAKTYRIHKIISNTFLENPNNKLCVDHIDGNIINNNINNLRFVTHSENQMNRKINKNNKLKIRGVYKMKNQDGFKVRINKDGKTYEKNFKTVEECIIWRKQKEEKLFGEYARKD